MFNMSDAAQGFSKLGQRISHWICNIKVTGNPDNGSFSSVTEKEDPLEQDEERKEKRRN